MAKTEVVIDSNVNASDCFEHQTGKTDNNVDNTLIVRENCGQEAVAVSEASPPELSATFATMVLRTPAILNGEDDIAQGNVDPLSQKMANECSLDSSDDMRSDTLKESDDLQRKDTEITIDNSRVEQGGQDGSRTPVKKTAGSTVEVLEEDECSRKNVEVHNLGGDSGAIDTVAGADPSEQIGTFSKTPVPPLDSNRLVKSSIQTNGQQEQEGILETTEGCPEKPEQRADPAGLGDLVDIASSCEGDGSADCSLAPKHQQEVPYEGHKSSNFDRASCEADKSSTSGEPSNDQLKAEADNNVATDHNNAEAHEEKHITKDFPEADTVAMSVEIEKQSVTKDFPDADTVAKSAENEEETCKVMTVVSSTTQVVASINSGTSTMLEGILMSTTVDPCKREMSNENVVVRKETGLDFDRASSQKPRRITPVARPDSQTQEAQVNGNLFHAQVGDRVADQEPLGLREYKIGTTGQLQGTDAEENGCAIGSIYGGSNQNSAPDQVVELQILNDTTANPRGGLEEPRNPEEAGGDSGDDQLDETSSDLGDASSLDSDEVDLHDLLDLFGLDEDTDLQDPAVLVDLLHRVECIAYEAQESLEEECVSRTRGEVRTELAETLTGSELDDAVEEEMTRYSIEWEDTYEDMQRYSPALQDKLEILGIDLPYVFKQIEKLASEGCVTETWRRRTHWAGSEATREVAVAVKSAEEDLAIHHPMRSQRGKLTAGGASGYLAKKLAAQAESKRAKSDAKEEQKHFTEAGDSFQAGTSDLEPQNDGGWSKVDDVLDVEDPAELGQTVRPKDWAAVYLVSTPEQAALMGLNLPGVNSVEEIGDLESERRSVYKAAVAKESKQKISVKKVNEEDDIKKERRGLKRYRYSRNRPLNAYSKLRPVKRPALEAKRGGVGDLEGKGLTALRQPGDVKHGEKKEIENAASVIGMLSDCSEIQRLGSKHAAESSRGQNVSEEVDHGVEASSQQNKAVYRDALERPLGSAPEDNASQALGSLNIKGKNKGVDDSCVHFHEVPAGNDRSTVGPTSLEAVPWESEKDDLKRKRSNDQEILISDDEKEEPTKKLKIFSISDRSSDKEQQGRDSTGAERQLVPYILKDDSKHVDLQVTTAKFRKVFVIDSDGEREVEEVLNDAAKRVNESVFKIRDRVSSPGPGGCNILARRTPQKERREALSRDGKQETSQSGEIGDQKRKAKVTTPEKGHANFPCTACEKPLRRKDVKRHPRLPVGVCEKCRRHYLSGPFNKGPDGWESECTWCGEGGDVICCDSCDSVFCHDCIGRNFGAAELARICGNEWKCFSCNPLALYKFEEQINQIELENQSIAGDDISPSSPMHVGESSIEQDDSDRQLSKGKRRKNIRKVLDDDELEEKHKQQMALEKERQERLDLWRATAGHKPSSSSSQRQTVALATPEKSDDESSRLINTAREENEEAVMIDNHLVRILKAHQKAGVRFMWENCIVSEQKVKEGAESFGCILAHSMGLGKTLQVITFIHTVLNRHLGLRTALIVVPLNVLHNWRREFEIWQADVANPVSVFMVEESVRDNAKRADLLARWQRRGGVMLIGYAAFRILCIGKHVKDREMRDQLCSALQNPGPDILVCDEAHTIKNIKADITQSLKQVKTRRRVALTGSPLQNNLMEYYCMVDFVREGFLGTPPVFKNRFQNPIENGQHADSTPRDVRLMKHRAHVLHKQLEGFVQRVDSSVLEDELPSRCVYVISVRLSRLQRQLYRHYLDLTEPKKGLQIQKNLFRAYHALSKIWNHPELLLMAEEQASISRKVEDPTEDYIADSDEEKSSEGEAEGNVRAGSRPLKSKGSFENMEPDKLWWKSVLPNDFPRDDPEFSGKTVLLLKLLAMSSRKGDKALVFTQSLNMLTLIERLIEKQFCSDAHGTGQRGKPWCRLDGSTPPAVRLQMCERFNDLQDTALKFMLISTRAGSLGINLPAANRVIIVDGSWNPTYDLQALFRVWRLGQRKPVYAYRFLAHGTMEEKIYGRQVAKQGMAARVLDEQQVDRHFAGEELERLFKLEEDGDRITTSVSVDVEYSLTRGGESSGAAHTSRSTLLAFTPSADAPRDVMMQSLLLDYRPRWVVSYHEHDPLLEHREEETLTKEEQEIAWALYKKGESAAVMAATYGMSSPFDFGDLDLSNLPFGASEALHVAASTIPHIATPSKLTTSHVQASSFSQGAGNVNVSSSNVHITARSTAASSSKCQIRDHAKLLNENQIQVQNHIVCPTCKLLVSWEALLGNKRQP